MACCCYNSSGDFASAHESTVRQSDYPLWKPPSDNCSLFQKPYKPVSANSPRRFYVSLERRLDKPIGLDIRTVDHLSLLVSGVQTGVVTAWNDTADISSQIRVGDRIDAINDFHGDSSELIRMLQSEKCLSMSLMRPAETWVFAHKPYNGLGLTVDPGVTGQFVRVIGTGPGPIEDFNKDHPSQAVGVNDHIVSVNGVKGNAAQILATLTHEQKLDIQFFRYSVYTLEL